MMRTDPRARPEDSLSVSSAFTRALWTRQSFVYPSAGRMWSRSVSSYERSVRGFNVAATRPSDRFA